MPVTIHTLMHNITEVRLYRQHDPDNLTMQIRDDAEHVHEVTMFGTCILVYDADGRTILPIAFGDCIWSPPEPHWIEAGYDNAVALGRLHRTVWRLAIWETTRSARRSLGHTSNSVGLLAVLFAVAFALGIFAGVLTR